VDYERSMSQELKDQSLWVRFYVWLGKKTIPGLDIKRWKFVPIETGLWKERHLGKWVKKRLWVDKRVK
jgi:hypothetical protein